MATHRPSTFAARFGAILFFFSCLAAVVPEFAGLILLLDRNWSAWLDLTAVSIAIVFVSSTLNYLLSGCFIPNCRA